MVDYKRFNCFSTKIKFSLILVPLLLLFFSSIFLYLQPVKIYAVDNLETVCTQFPDSDVCQQRAADSTGNKVGGSDGILSKIVQFIIYLTGSVSLLMVVFGGAKYVLSQGDANQTKSAKDTILYALIGLFISINAMFVVRYVVSRL
jgi:hypothetical protein